MYGNRSVFAFTCEIYTNDSAWQYEPGPEPNTWWEKGVTQYFSPDADRIEATIEKWYPVFTYLTNRAIAEAYDVAVTNVTALKTIVGQGYTMNVSATVTNEGDLTETFNVTLFVDSTVAQTRTLTLPSKDSATVTFMWNTSGFAKGNYTIRAAAETIFAETDTSDNTLNDGSAYVGVAGDVDGNHIVNMLDLYKIALRYGAVVGQPEYIPDYDVDNNGIVNMLDLYVAAVHFGQMDP
jgi:hypothetical protein